VPKLILTAITSSATRGASAVALAPLFRSGMVIVYQRHNPNFSGVRVFRGLSKKFVPLS
jgi:hypothetical protein